jgi:hypothetical protein
MELVLQYLLSLWEGLFSTPIAELNAVQVGVLGLLSFGGIKVLQLLFKTSKAGAKVVFKGAKSFLHVLSPKHRASKTVCLHCGRTLDKCVCPSNKGLSYSQRLKKHKLEVKALQLAKKAKI